MPQCYVGRDSFSRRYQCGPTAASRSAERHACVRGRQGLQTCIRTEGLLQYHKPQPLSTSFVQAWLLKTNIAANNNARTNTANKRSSRSLVWKTRSCCRSNRWRFQDLLIKWARRPSSSRTLDKIAREIDEASANAFATGLLCGVDLLYLPIYIVVTSCVSGHKK